MFVLIFFKVNIRVLNIFLFDKFPSPGRIRNPHPSVAPRFGSARMELPSRDLLMLDPSLNRMPLLPVTQPFSDPARSIMESFATFTSADRPESLSFCCTNTCTEHHHDHNQVVNGSVARESFQTED